MDRIIGFNVDFTAVGSTQSWTAPAGVTQIIVSFGDRTTPATMRISGVPLTVVPNTNYVFTISNVTYTAYGSANTFGSLLTWNGANRIYIQWVE